MKKFNFQALKATAKFKAEIIIPVNGGLQSLLTRLYCWFKGKKMVIIGMAGLGWCDGWNLLMRPDCFVASTQRNARWAKRFYGLGVKIKIIPHGVDLSQFTLKGKKKHFQVKGPIILCISGPNEYKRVEATIKAVSGLKQGSLILVGGSDEWASLGKKQLKNRFVRIQAEHKELPEIYRGAAVFTLVSESCEEFGIVNIEALACGLPVVATDDALRREILGEFGIYVKDVWGAEYSEKLKLALKRQKRRPDQWLERFNWDKLAKEFEAVFFLLLGRNKGLASG